MLPQTMILAIYSFAMFVSAGIMFALQPMVGKMLLPLVGGTPAGWVVTLAFFQLMLLGGYLIAHVLSGLTARVHGIVYLILMAVGFAFLPVHLNATVSDHPGAFDIFRLLAATVAVPFIALSATSSTLQRLFGTTGHKWAADPYFLYAASNLGSFAGLIFYPAFMEAHWGLGEQADKWRIGFAVLIALATTCLLFAKKEPRTAAPIAVSSERTQTAQRLRWMLLAFFPSALLSAVTTHITTDVFSAPLIWILPLAIYLLTFVIAFARHALFRFEDIARWHRLVVPLAVVLTCVYNLNIRVSVYAMGFHIFAFGVAALACHMLLAKSRPAGTGRQLTEYYLLMSLGGAAGGLLNAFVFPVILDRLIEYPVLMALSLMM
ncbi:MAG TPA: class I SAM-dependent methyltransferase, partial [Patescibacteria group bacterium]|nr:class I SAM-dependent methyltransferase [Patescibacteria group bacterium]